MPNPIEGAGDVSAGPAAAQAAGDERRVEQADRCPGELLFPDDHLRARNDVKKVIPVPIVAPGLKGDAQVAAQSGQAHGTRSMDHQGNQLTSMAGAHLDWDGVGIDPVQVGFASIPQVLAGTEGPTPSVCAPVLPEGVSCASRHVMTQSAMAGD